MRTEETYIEYIYDEIQYTKDEYIELLGNQPINTQLALIELYEQSNN